MGKLKNAVKAVKAAKAAYDVWNEHTSSSEKKLKDLGHSEDKRQTAKAAKAAHDIRNVLLNEAKKRLAKEAEEKLKDLGNSKDGFRKSLERISDEELSALYVPDVYQKDILGIDYEKLKEQGIKLISYDIDDTIAALWASKVPTSVSMLFKELKRMGVAVALLTNNSVEKGKSFSEKLGVDYVAEAKKPSWIGFQAVLTDYEERFHETLDKSCMAHVGNHIRKDVMGGNAFGITTCLSPQCHIHAL